MKDKKKFASICAKSWDGRTSTTPHQLPIYATSSFAFASIDEGMRIFGKEEKGYVYTRYGNPTIDVVEEKITALECHGLDTEAKGVMFSSGMAAIHTLGLALLKPGDAILTQGNLYGGTTEMFTRIHQALGVKVLFTNLKDLNKVEHRLKAEENIRLLFFETPSNPTLECVDIPQLCALAKKYNVHTAMDNTFATPYLQQPFRFGVDFIVHSTTKFLNGHGNSIAGILIGRDVDFVRDRIWEAMKLTGSNCNAFDAWLVFNGLKTLPLRMDRHCANAMTLAEFLDAHPKVSQVNYTGLRDHPSHILAKKQMRKFGGMLSFEVQGGLDAGIACMRKIRFCSLAPTLGDVDTLILHPASMSHRNIPKEMRLQNGITDGLIRVSVGIEDVEDIVGDLERALE